MNSKLKSLNVAAAKRYGLICCHPDTLLGDAARMLVEQDISCLVVVNAVGDLLGVLSRTDFLPLFFSSDDWHNKPVTCCMSRHVITIMQDATLADVAECLLTHRIHRVVVLSNQTGRPRPVAVIADTDLLIQMVDSIS